MSSHILAAAAMSLSLYSQAEISFRERSPLIMVTIIPKGAPLETRSSELLSIAGRVAEKRTNLSVISVEQAGGDLAELGACELRERISCWVRAVRRQSPARYLFVLSVHPQPEGADRFTALWIDTAAVLELAEPTEDLIFRRAVLSEISQVDASAPGALDRYFERLFDEILKPKLEAAGAWMPYGEIELLDTIAGLEIAIDGKAAGLTGAGRTRISEVMPGSRTLILSGTNPVFTTRVEVARGSTSTVRVTLAPEPVERSEAIERATFWSGVGLGTIGAVLATYALIAQPGSEVRRPCTGVECSGEPSTRFASFCQLGADPASCAPGGLRAAPLGYGVALTGLIFALGSKLEDREVPWISIAAGIAAGAAAYGFSVAFDQGR